MNTIKTYPLNHSTILRINADKPLINVEPEYQRRGDIWTLEKRQLLIDSILNDYDIPKIYFHTLTNKRKIAGKQEFDYAIIDGRQRLEAIWLFIDDQFSLSEDFTYFKDPGIKAGGLTYSDLAKQHPRLKIFFDSFTLPIICVETDDVDLIEDMFSRLNEAVPLNAAEKRNAIGGPMAKIIKNISIHLFFKENVKFTDRRYQHREVAARLLFLEHSLKYSKRIIDTKKPLLDEFVRLYKRDNKLKAGLLSVKVTMILNIMKDLFGKNDELLQAQSAVPLYYLLFRGAVDEDTTSLITRRKLLDFRKELEKNRNIAQEDITKANFDYLEFDRLSQQGTNDASSIRERLRILREYLGLLEPLEEV